MALQIIDLDQVSQRSIVDNPHIGGENRFGERYGVTNYYLTHNGKPFFGVSGEFQFSRFPEAYWEEELLKMKATGVNIVATYLFWIHHELQPGVFDWNGNKDARRFVELCAKHGLSVIARIGPFAHGECRNGGLPDWLYGMPFEVRSNDPAYLDCVKRYYTQIGEQLQGLFFKDGGPIMCIQLDNEYEHTGAPWDTADRSAPVEWLPKGSAGAEHLSRLKQLAQVAGLVTPLYTVTGWGSPVVEDEMLPVHGGYAYPVWIDNPEPSDLYLFYDRQALPSPDARYRRPYYYPLINAEMQGGIQVRYNNRPVVPARSTEALTLVQMGSGCNFIGYYVYHGGSNPRVNGVYANEVLHPQVSYDFQAPIGEFGQVREAARCVKGLHLFLHSFGEQLTPMQPVFPCAEVPPNEAARRDTASVRYAARVKDGRGFLFLNNFQDHLETQAIPDVRFELELGAEKITLPSQNALTLEAGVCCLLPLNLDLAGARLVYATAQPLTVLDSPDELHYFFFAPQGIRPEYCFAVDSVSGFDGGTGRMIRENGRVVLYPAAGWRNSFTVKSASGKTVRVTTLAREEAEHAWVGSAWGCPRLVISNADPIFVDGGLEFRSEGESEFDAVVFPALDRALEAVGGSLSQTYFENPNPGNHIPAASVLRFGCPANEPDVRIEPCREANKRFLHFAGDLLEGVNDVFLNVDYTGDIAEAFIDGNLVADHYNNGTAWVIGLKRFAPQILEHGLVLRFRPLRKGKIQNVSNAMAARMEFAGEEKLEIHKVECTPEYAVRVILKPTDRL
jgi:hypothetical protein